MYMYLYVVCYVAFFFLNLLSLSLHHCDVILQVDWRSEIEGHLSKMRLEGLSPPQADTELVQQREEELK